MEGEGGRGRGGGGVQVEEEEEEGEGGEPELSRLPAEVEMEGRDAFVLRIPR
jgi:hypothetical protein